MIKYKYLRIKTKPFSMFVAEAKWRVTLHYLSPSHEALGQGTVLQEASGDTRPSYHFQMVVDRAS